MRRRLKNLSIHHKLHVAIIGTSSIAILIAGLAFAAVQWRLTSQSLNQDLDTLAQMLATNSSAAITFNDEYAATGILSSLQARPAIQIACLFATSPQGPINFASYVSPASNVACHPHMLISEARSGHIRGSAQVKFDGDVLGHLLILERKVRLWSGLKRNLSYLALIFLACLVVSFLLSSWLQKLVSGPVIKLSRVTGEISESGNFSLRAENTGEDEIGRLVLSFNSMLDKIEAAETQLRDLNVDLKGQVIQKNQANQALQETLDQLRNAQDQLVQTEKMASLGGLVAGVAHEINTPVGIGVTAASTLLAKVQELRDAYQQETLTENGLKSFLDLAEQSGAIIASNLERAASLIQSFKQVAVDQSTLEHRRFNLASYIDEVLLSLKPKLKHRQIQVVVHCPKDLCIDSYPGLLSQILTNLVMNALNHAYGSSDKGTIHIRVQASPNGFHLDFSDDGCGIEERDLKRIFDPFFTTKRGDGGSGLGLHIVFNLVTQQLGGRIKVESQVGVGTHFHLEIQQLSDEVNHDIAQAS